MSTWLRRVWHLLNRSQRERELVREMREHRESMTDQSRFGDTHRFIEQSRDAWGWNWLDDATQDLRFALRGIGRAPVFAVTAILILSFGIGLNLTVFQLATTVLLRGPAIAHPETLARLHRHGEGRRSNSEMVPHAMAQAVARETTALSAVLVEANAPVVWGKQATVVDASFVSASWFLTLGQRALLGRVFAPQIDEASGAVPTAIVSERFWRSALGANPAVIGTSIEINQRPVTLIGVMPETAAELDLDASGVWLPIHQRDYYFPGSGFLTDWDSNNVAMYGRLKEGVTPSTLRENLRNVLAALHREHPDQIGAGDWLEPALATKNFTEPAERFAFMGVASAIGSLSAMVLIVAAANIGNLVLSRAAGRARELGVRAALGASRSRVVRQLAIETLPIGISGAAGGIAFALAATRMIAVLGGLPPYLNLAPDLPAIGVGFLCAALALAVAGALPAWRVSRHDLTDAIKDGGQQVSIRLDRAHLRSLMLAAQVAGSCLILVVSAMMVRSVQRALSANPGFEYEQTAVVQGALAPAGLRGEAAKSYWLGVKERVAASPEVRDAVLVTTPPFEGRVNIDDFPEAPRLRVINNRVEPRYFALMGIPVLRGRTFHAADDPNTTVVISRTLAERMYGSTDVIGSGFPRSSPRDTIVGVAGDAPVARPGAPDVAEIYRPLSSGDYERAALLARARTSTATLLPALRAAASTDSRVFVYPRLLSDDFNRRMSGSRVASAIAVSIGLLTLLLACIGIFGVVSYSATLRTKELGIHLALGASRSAIVRVVTRHVGSPLAGGVVAGSVIAVPIAFALARSPLQLAFADPIAYVAAVSILGAAGALAATVPALRALRTNPIRTLRHE